MQEIAFPPPPLLLKYIYVCKNIKNAVIMTILCTDLNMVNRTHKGRGGVKSKIWTSSDANFNIGWP